MIILKRRLDNVVSTWDDVHYVKNSVLWWWTNVSFTAASCQLYCSQWWQRHSNGVCTYARIPLSFYGTVNFFLFFSVSFFFFSLSHMYVYPRLNTVSFCESANQSTVYQWINQSTSLATPADFVYSTIHHQRTSSNCINKSITPP